MFESEVDHRRGVEREHLRNNEPADDRDAERLTQLRADPVSQRQRQRAEQRGHRRHHDRAKPNHARLVDRLLR